MLNTYMKWLVGYWASSLCSDLGRSLRTSYHSDAISMPACPCEIYGEPVAFGENFLWSRLVLSLGIIPPMLHTHLYLIITLTEKQTRSLWTFWKKANFFRAQVHTHLSLVFQLFCKTGNSKEILVLDHSLWFNKLVFVCVNVSLLNFCLLDTAVLSQYNACHT